MALLVTQLTDLQLIDKIAPYLNLADFKNETYGAHGSALHAAMQQERRVGVIYQFKGHLPKPYDSATDEIALIPVTRGGLWWFIARMKQPFHMSGDCDKLLPFLASHEQHKELIEISRNVSNFSDGSIYCAGPDVFYNDVYQRRMRLTEHFDSLRMFGLGQTSLPDLPHQPSGYPVDLVLTFKLPENTSSTHPKEIYETCLHHIEKSRGVLANLSPFNGIEPDSGTVMEVGYAHALGRPIYAYTNDLRSTSQKYLDSTDPDKDKY